MTAEFWTTVRLLLYPILLVLALAWATLFWVRYRQARLLSSAWAFWLGLAVAALGASGFGSLLVARAQGGYSSITSAMLTAGLIVIVVVLVAGVLAMGATMWRTR